MILKDLYKYSFYILYKICCFSSSWGADWRAVAILVGADLFLFISLFAYSGLLFTIKYSIITLQWYLIIVGIKLYIFNYKFFYSSNQWKEIITRYDKWPDNKNIFRGFIVFLFLMMIFANFLISIGLYKTLVFNT